MYLNINKVCYGQGYIQTNPDLAKK